MQNSSSVLNKDEDDNDNLWYWPVACFLFSLQAMTLDRWGFKTVHEIVIQSGLYPLGAVIGAIVFPQNPYVESPTPNMTVFRDRAF